MDRVPSDIIKKHILPYLNVIDSVKFGTTAKRYRGIIRPLYEEYEEYSRYHGMIKAARENRMDLIQHYVSTGLPIHGDVVAEAAEYNRIELLQYLGLHSANLQFSVFICEGAIRGDNVNLLKRYWRFVPDTLKSSIKITMPANSKEIYDFLWPMGDALTFEEFISDRKIFSIQKLRGIIRRVKFKDINLLRFDEVSEMAIRFAAEYGKCEYYFYLVEKYGIPRSGNLLALAIKGGEPRIINHILENESQDYDIALCQACLTANLRLIRQLLTKVDEITYHHVALGIKSGDMICTKFICDEYVRRSDGEIPCWDFNHVPDSPCKNYAIMYFTEFIN